MPSSPSMMPNVPSVSEEYDAAGLAALDAIAVRDPAAFHVMAAREPSRLIVLRSATALTAALVREHCLALGGVREYDSDGVVRSVHHDPAIPDSTAMSLAGLAPHSDGTFLSRPPARFLLAFATADQNGGGISTFIPLSRILADAPDWVMRALLTADLLFVRSYDGDLTVSHIGPALWRTADGFGIRWRSDHLHRPEVIDAHGTRAAEAVDWLHDYLAETPPLTYAAQAGEILLVPNHLMLHGRTPLSPDSPRVVLRAWVA